MYEFTQDCLTGIDQIDEEHRKLFSLINEAVELPKEARTPQTVKNILEHLSDYAVNHFAHEEAYMEAQNDPELPLQKVIVVIKDRIILHVLSFLWACSVAFMLVGST